MWRGQVEYQNLRFKLNSSRDVGRNLLLKEFAAEANRNPNIPQASKKRSFSLVEGQKPVEGKRYKVAASGSYYVPSEHLHSEKILPQSLEDWEKSFQRPSMVPRLLYV